MKKRFKFYIKLKILKFCWFLTFKIGLGLKLVNLDNFSKIIKVKKYNIDDYFEKSVIKTLFQYYLPEGYIDYKFEQYSIHQIDNCVVKNGIIISNQFQSNQNYLNSHRLMSNENLDFIYKQKPCLSYLSFPRDQTVIFLTTKSINNYYHFLYDLVTQLQFVPETEFSKIIIFGLKRKKFIEFLISKFEFEFIFLSDERTCMRFKTLKVITTNLVPGYNTKRKIDFLANLVDKNLQSSLSSLRRIYISRRNADKRRIINENEFLNYLNLFNFKELILEDFSIADQAYIFHNSEIIISPHGASLANLCFCSDSNVIEIFNNKYINPTYNLICLEKSLKYHQYMSDSTNISEDIFIDLEIFNERFSSLLMS